MNEAPEAAQPTTSAPQPARRSRWQRFSPSMGWPAFWSEILIVVLGVVIALAASEAVQDFSWRNKVRDGEVRLRADTLRLFVWSAEQFATYPCVDAQLDRLAANVMASDAVLNPAPVFSDASIPQNPKFVLRLATRPWRFTAWDALVSDGTATHFSQQSQDLYGATSESAARMRAVRLEFDELIGRQMAMSYPIALDAGVRMSLLADIELLRRLSLANSITSRQMMSSLLAGGSAPDVESVASELEASGTVKFCKEHELPMADWRDIRETGVSSISPAPVKSP